MGLFGGCLLASDIDGTLISNGFINPENIKKIEFFIKEGGTFSLSTGRSPGAVLPILKELGEVSPSVTLNGAMIYDFKIKKIVKQSVLPSEDYEIADMIANEFPNVGIEVHSGSEIYLLNRTQESDDHEEYEELSVIPADYEKTKLCGWNKVIYMCDSLKTREEVKEKVAKLKHNCTFVETSAEIYGVRRNYFEQIPKGVSKLAALKDICKIYNIKPGGFFAIGDYYNDLEMIKSADIGAAVAESPQDIKDSADFVAVPCSDGAVADFINYLTEKCKTSGI